MCIGIYEVYGVPEEWNIGETGYRNTRDNVIRGKGKGTDLEQCTICESEANQNEPY